VREEERDTERETEREERIAPTKYKRMREGAIAHESTPTPTLTVCSCCCVF
jgi:hypothetical protein